MGIVAAQDTRDAMVLLRQLQRARRKLRRFIAASESRRKAAQRTQALASLLPGNGPRTTGDH
jgi:hypothetical protein